jgi:hypothetical protein
MVMFIRPSEMANPSIGNAKCLAVSYQTKNLLKRA